MHHYPHMHLNQMPVTSIPQKNLNHHHPQMIPIPQYHTKFNQIRNPTFI